MVEAASVTWALVLVLAATAGFTALVVRRTPRRSAPVRPDLRSLLDVGAAVLGVLAVAVTVTVLVTDRPDQGAKLAVLGLLSYLVYVGAAAVITRGR